MSSAAMPGSCCQGFLGVRVLGLPFTGSRVYFSWNGPIRVTTWAQGLGFRPFWSLVFDVSVSGLGLHGGLRASLAAAGFGCAGAVQGSFGFRD